MRYKVKGRDTVEPTISFACSGCQGRLKAPLTDAGSEHACPQCKVRLIVPGEGELKDWLDERLAMRDTATTAPAASSLTDHDAKLNRAEPDSPQPKHRSTPQSDSAKGPRADGRLDGVFRAVQMFCLVLIGLDLIGIVLATGVMCAMIFNWIPDDAVRRTALEVSIVSGLTLLIPLIIVPLLVHIEQHLRAIRRSLELKNDV